MQYERYGGVIKIDISHASYLSLSPKATVLNVKNMTNDFLQKLKSTNVEDVALAIVNKDESNSLAKEYLEWARSIYKLEKS